MGVLMGVLGRRRGYLSLSEMDQNLILYTQSTAQSDHTTSEIQAEVGRGGVI